MGNQAQKSTEDSQLSQKSISIIGKVFSVVIPVLVMIAALMVMSLVFNSCVSN